MARTRTAKGSNEAVKRRQEAAERLAARRENEDRLVATAADQLASIDESQRTLDAAIETHKMETETATINLGQVVGELIDSGLKADEVAEVLGVDKATVTAARTAYRRFEGDVANPEPGGGEPPES
jgi:seryl-tRNA synthetase